MSKSFEEIDLESLTAEVDSASAVEPLGDNPTVQDIVEWIQRRISIETGEKPEDIDATAPLTEIGLSSIAALSMTGDLSEAMNRDLPDTLMWNHPTIYSVGQFLGCDAEIDPDAPDPLHSARSRQLGISDTHYQRLFDRTASWGAPRARPGFLTIVIAEVPDSVPIVWIGDFKGSHPLATRVGQTVYAIPSGYRLLCHTKDNVRALAELYAWEIQQIIPKGQRFIMAGYCFGGKLALQTAEVLAREKQPPRSTVLVECPGEEPSYWRAYKLANRLADDRRRERLIYHGNRFFADGPLGATRYISALVKRAINRRIGDAATENIAPEVLEESTTHWEYRPKPTKLPVILVFAQGSRYRMPFSPKYGWENTLLGPHKVIHQRGDHFSIITPSDVGPLAKTFNWLSNGKKSKKEMPA